MNTKSKIWTSVLVIGLIILSITLWFILNGTASELQQTNDENFVLHVSDQSFEISPVDIKIFIDGKLVVDEEFDVGGQHNWEAYSFDLQPGTHTIKAISEKGEAVLEQEFEIIDKHWAVIDYWYYPEGSMGAKSTQKHFSFDIQDTQIAFM